MKYIKDIEIKNKKVILRSDLNVTIKDGKIIEYNILLEFTSNDNGKKYIFYTDELNKNIYISYYRIENDLYILEPIKNQEEIDMCMNILEDLKNM